MGDRKGCGTGFEKTEVSGAEYVLRNWAIVKYDLLASLVKN